MGRTEITLITRRNETRGSQGETPQLYLYGAMK